MLQEESNDFPWISNEEVSSTISISCPPSKHDSLTPAVLYSTYCNYVLMCSQPTTPASDQYIGELFNQTNAAILDEIKKDERLQQAAMCYKHTDADESVSSDSQPKSSSCKIPSSISSLCDGEAPASSTSTSQQHSEGCRHGHDDHPTQTCAL
jgi:hypothetical protein